MSDDEVTEGDEQVEESASDSGGASGGVVAHHVVPLPILVTDSNDDSGALVKFVESDMCMMFGASGWMMKRLSRSED